MNEWCLKRVSKFKLLGVWQQDNLHVCWNYHVEQTVKKASKRFYCTNAFVLMLLVCDSPRYKLTATDTKKQPSFLWTEILTLEIACDAPMWTKY